VSTISREVVRNGGWCAYRAARADERALENTRRPKPCLLAFNPTLCKLVAGKLSEQWSPQQIAGWLRTQHPGDPSMNVSHETIYKSLFIQAPRTEELGVLKKELLAHLRSRRIMRRGRTSKTIGQTRGQVIDAVLIRDRPAEIEDRAIPLNSLPGRTFAKQMSREGEGDLLSCAKNSHIATLVERTSRFVMLVKVGGKDSDSVVGALIRQVQYLPQGLMASLTWDRGTERVYHRKFTVATTLKRAHLKSSLDTATQCPDDNRWQRLLPPLSCIYDAFPGNGQHFRRTAVTVVKVRMRLPACLGNRIGSQSWRQKMDRVLQPQASAFLSWRQTTCCGPLARN